MTNDAPMTKSTWVCLGCLLRSGDHCPVAPSEWIIRTFPDGEPPLVAHLREGELCGPVFREPEGEGDASHAS